MTPALPNRMLRDELTSHCRSLSRVTGTDPSREGDRNMATYIVYRLNGEGKIRAAEWIEAGDDHDALAQARRLEARGECEIWHRDRRIGRVESWRL